MKHTPEELMKLLCSLTPGGSEFVDEPEYCVQYIRERLVSKSKKIVSICEANSKQRRTINALVEALEECTRLLKALISKKDLKSLENGSLTFFEQVLAQAKGE